MADYPQTYGDGVYGTGFYGLPTLEPSGIAATPSLGSPTLTQQHSLSPTGFETGVPYLGSPLLSTPLVPVSFDTGVPTLGTSALTQVHRLSVPALEATPVLGTPIITQHHIFGPTGIAATPTLGVPSVFHTVSGWVIPNPESDGWSDVAKVSDAWTPISKSATNWS